MYLIKKNQTIIIINNKDYNLNKMEKNNINKFIKKNETISYVSTLHTIIAL